MVVLDADAELTGDPFEAADSPALAEYQLIGLLEDEQSRAVSSLNSGTMFIRCALVGGCG